MRKCNGGDLLDYTLHHDVAEPVAKRIFWPVIRAIHWLHDRGWAHRSIQPENVLLDHDGASPDAIPTAFLSDLSFAQQFRFGREVRKFQKPVGAIPYSAPEILRGAPYDQSVDIWAFGASLLVALTGRPAFSIDPEADRATFITYAEEEEFEMGALREKGVSQDGITLITQCLKAVPNERLTAEQVMTHRFFKDVAG
jgi:serine/threonine protein kinase